MEDISDLLEHLPGLIECFIWWRLVSNVLERKYHKNFLVLAAAFMFVLILAKFYVFHIPGLSKYQAIGSAVTMLYSLLIFIFLFRNSLVEKFVWWGVYYFGLIIMEMITILFLIVIVNKPLEALGPYDWLSLSVILLGKLFTLLLFELIIRKRSRKLIIAITYSKELAAVVILNSLLLVGVVFLFTNKPYISKNLDYIILFYFWVVLLYTLFSVLLIYRIEKKSNEELATQLKLQQIEMELKLNDDMKTSTDRLRKLRHDMNNHIGLIKTLVYTQKYEELKEYTDQLYEDVEIANDLVITGNKTLSVLLNTKKNRAKEKNIEFTCILATEDIDMQDKDICTLLGNILDNAIEAADKSENGKYIELTIQKTQDGCVINCENSFGIRPEVIDGRFITGKKNARIHGIGTEIIKDIVSKYHGDIRFNYEEDIFSVRVVMPV